MIIAMPAYYDKARTNKDHDFVNKGLGRLVNLRAKMEERVNLITTVFPRAVGLRLGALNRVCVPFRLPCRLCCNTVCTGARTSTTLAISPDLCPRARGSGGRGDVRQVKMNNRRRSVSLSCPLLLSPLRLTPLQPSPRSPPPLHPPSGRARAHRRPDHARGR